MKRRALQSPVRARTPLASKLRLSHPVDGSTIATDSGAYLRFIRVDGAVFEGADDEEINERHQQLCNVLRRHAKPQVRFYFQLSRDEYGELDVPEPGQSWASQFAARYARAKLLDPPMLINEWIVTIEFRPGKGDVFDSVAQLFGVRPDGWTADVSSDFDEITQDVLHGLSGFGARLMGTYADSLGIASEPMAWLHFLVSGYRVRVSAALPERVSDVVATADLYAGMRGAIEITTPGAPLYVQMVGCKKLAHETDQDEAGDVYAYTAPGLLRRLMEGPPVLVSHYWEPEEQDSARGQVERERGRKEVGGDKSGQADEMNEIAGALQAEAAARGHYSFVVAVKARSMAELKRRTGDVVGRLRSRQALADAHTGTALAAYLEMIPGCADRRTSSVPVMHSNVAAWAGLHGYPHGQRDGNHWGRCILVLRGTDGSPVHLNFHVGDLGHTFLSGKSGRGKTTAMAMTMAHVERFDALQIAFDYRDGLTLPARRMGWSELRIKRGYPSGINPFALPDTTESRLLVEQIIEWAVTEGGRMPLSHEDRAELSRGVAGVFGSRQAHLKRLRYLPSHISEAPKPDALKARLARWINNGPLAWVLDNEVDEFTQMLAGGARGIRIETMSFADDALIGPPILMYLFHQVQRQLTGQRLVLWWGEVQRGARHDRMGVMLRDSLETFRRLNAAVVMDTQQPQNLAGTLIGEHVSSQTATQIYFRDPSADADTYMGRYHLNEAEFDLVRHGLNELRREALIKQGGRSFVASFDITGLHEDLAVLSSTEANVRISDDIRAELGRDDWDEFHRRRVAFEASQTVKEKLGC